MLCSFVDEGKFYLKEGKTCINLMVHQTVVLPVGHLLITQSAFVLLARKTRQALPRTFQALTTGSSSKILSPECFRLWVEGFYMHNCALCCWSCRTGGLHKGMLFNTRRSIRHAERKPGLLLTLLQPQLRSAAYRTKCSDIVWKTRGLKGAFSVLNKLF